MFVPRVVETLALPEPHPGDTFQSVLCGRSNPRRRPPNRRDENSIFARFQAERPFLGAGVETVIPPARQGATEPRPFRPNPHPSCLKLGSTQRQTRSADQELVTAPGPPVRHALRRVHHLCPRSFNRERLVCPATSCQERLMDAISAARSGCGERDVGPERRRREPLQRLLTAAVIQPPRSIAHIDAEQRPARFAEDAEDHREPVQGPARHQGLRQEASVPSGGRGRVMVRQPATGRRHRRRGRMSRASAQARPAPAPPADAARRRCSGSCSWRGTCPPWRWPVR